MLSTSSAPFIELKARIARQQTECVCKEKVTTDHLFQIERQLHPRFDKVESKLDTLKGNLNTKLDNSHQLQAADL